MLFRVRVLLHPSPTDYGLWSRNEEKMHHMSTAVLTGRGKSLKACTGLETPKDTLVCPVDLDIELLPSSSQ